MKTPGHRGAAVAAVSMLAALALSPATARRPAYPGLSSFLARALGVTPGPAPATPPSAYPPAPRALAAPDVLSETNVMRAGDVVERQDLSADPPILSCNPGKQTAQNETTIAVNPSDPDNLVGGTNDYRLYNPRIFRFDGAGGVYTSFDGGRTWRIGLLPGLVKWNRAAPGPYETAGDPAVAAGPGGVFWYANIAFDRTFDHSGIAVSRSTNGGLTWTTRFVVRDSGGQILNDKEWVAADPRNPNVAYVTWSRFVSGLQATIVLSKTVDGGRQWSKPAVISTLPVNQGSVVQVGRDGRVHVVWAAGLVALAYAVSDDGGATFETRILAPISVIDEVLLGSSFRASSLPGFALDGDALHVVWPNWNGVSADVVYVRSTDGGATWSLPAVLGPLEGDQFMPWVGASNGRVAVSWFDRAERNDRYIVGAVVSRDAGASWSDRVTLTSATSDAGRGNRSGENCDIFIGDYGGIAVGRDGVAHPLWTDVRDGNSPGDPATTADQDPYTARIPIR
jgi:hypothetical protein